MKTLILTLSLLALGSASCAAHAAGITQSIVHLRHTEATEMMQTLDQFLADAKASGTPYPSIRGADGTDNSLLIEGDPAHVQEVLRLIANLDKERPR
jgi:type II secretory pathway component GspD/PulD (secretin)